MGDTNPIRTLGDNSRPSHEGYRNTIELPEGNNVVPLLFDTIQLVQNGCSFHGLRSEDPNQHLKDFLKLLDSPDLDQDPSPHGRILLLVYLLNSFHQEGLQNFAITSLCSNNIKESLFLKHELISRTYSKKSLIMASTFGSKNTKESWALLEDLALYDKESSNDPRDFAKPVKAISLSQDVPSTSNCHLNKLENQVQRLMEAHLAPKKPIQVNKITSSSGGEQLAMNKGPRIFNEAANAWKEKPNFNWAHAQTFTIPRNGSFSTYSSCYQMKLEKALTDFDSHQERRLSSLRAQLGKQQDDMVSKINLLWKAISEKLDNMATRNTAGNPTAQMNFASIDYPTKEEL
ncbi:hypothetical protein Tco_0204370 [Tanacetum coccineum]